MNNLRIFVCISLIACISSCEQNDNIGIDPGMRLTFDLEQSNSGNDFTAHAERILKEQKQSQWRDFGRDSAMLIREISFEVLLSNGDTVDFGLWFIKYENSMVLDLENEELDFRERNWDYKDPAVESENFYRGFKEARVLINSNVIFYDAQDENFRFMKVDELVSDGRKRTCIELSFGGEAYGWYDPYGQFQPVYKIKNGNLMGVIK